MGSCSTSGARKGEYTVPVGYDTSFKEKMCRPHCIWSETDGMAVSYLPQLLDCVPSCEG